MRADLERRFTVSPATAPTVERNARGPTLVGYGAVFFNPSDVKGTTYKFRGMSERIRRGAFAKVLARRDDVLALIDHNIERLLGRTANGTMRLTEDRVGLRYSIDLPNTTIGNDLAELVQRGDIRGSSFSFWLQPEGEHVYVADDGAVIREIVEVAMCGDCGPVAQPAYTGTSVSLASAGRITQPAGASSEFAWTAEQEAEWQQQCELEDTLRAIRNRAQRVHRDLIDDRVREITRSEINDRVRVVTMENGQC